MKNMILDWIGGQCPVQAEGFINSIPFYFRARGTHWTLYIGNDPMCNPEWEYKELWSTEEFSAGWMTEEEAISCIEKAINIWLTKKGKI